MMINETQTQGFQVAVDLGYNSDENLVRYGISCKGQLMAKEGLNVRSMGKHRFVGSYDLDSHEFYLGDEKSIREFAERLEALVETGLIESVHVDEF